MLKIKRICFLIIIFLLCGCTIIKDYDYHKAKCNDIEYDILYIESWSSSNYELTLTNGEKIEVHPMNCVFYNSVEEIGSNKE